MTPLEIAGLLLVKLPVYRDNRGYFLEKFGVDITARFQESLARLRSWGVLDAEGDWLRLTREGLLQVDRLVHEFFLPEHRNARYA